MNRKTFLKAVLGVGSAGAVVGCHNRPRSEVVVTKDSEERLQKEVAVSCASWGYPPAMEIKQGHPYWTLALQDTQDLYRKYDKLYRVVHGL